jgi:hypothetical protein
MLKTRNCQRREILQTVESQPDEEVIMLGDGGNNKYS